MLLLLDHSNQHFCVLIPIVLNISSIMQVAAIICELLIPLVYLFLMHPILLRLPFSHLPLRAGWASRHHYLQLHSIFLQAWSPTHSNLCWIRTVQYSITYNHWVLSTAPKVPLRVDHGSHQNTSIVHCEIRHSTQMLTLSFHQSISYIFWTPNLYQRTQWEWICYSSYPLFFSPTPVYNILMTTLLLTHFSHTCVLYSHGHSSYDSFFSYSCTSFSWLLHSDS